MKTGGISKESLSFQAEHQLSPLGKVQTNFSNKDKSLLVGISYIFP